MTTIAASPLSEALQALVDARLDTIDRMLLGRVDRRDRMAIVREVESQVFDLLRGRDAGSLDRDDVLAVLARLDPPEAYLPDEDDPTRPMRMPAATAPRAASTAARGGRLALAGGVLGIVASTLILFCASMEFGVLETKFVFFGAAGVAFIACILAIIFAARVRLRGPWAIVGLVNGILSLLALLAFAGLILAGG